MARKTNCTGLDPGCFTGPGREEPKSWIGAGTDGRISPQSAEGLGSPAVGQAGAGNPCGREPRHARQVGDYPQDHRQEA